MLLVLFLIAWRCEAVVSRLAGRAYMNLTEATTARTKLKTMMRTSVRSQTRTTAKTKQEDSGEDEESEQEASLADEEKNARIIEGFKEAEQVAESTGFESASTGENDDFVPPQGATETEAEGGDMNEDYPDEGPPQLVQDDPEESIDTSGVADDNGQNEGMDDESESLDFLDSGAYKHRMKHESEGGEDEDDDETSDESSADMGSLVTSDAFGYMPDVGADHDGDTQEALETEGDDADDIF